jgi:hypothetical protein
MPLKSHSFQRLGRFAVPGVLSIGLLAAAGCGSTLRQIDLYKGESVQVSLREVVEGGRARPQGYGHPASLAPEEVHSMLGAVGFEEFAYFSWRDKGPLFTEGELSQLAPKLVEGLRKATADQWVYFSVSGMRSWLGIATARLSDGICFVKDGKFNLVLGNISFALTQQATGTAEPSRIDPRDQKTLENVRLTGKTSGLRVAPPPVVRGDRWLGSERRNWLVFDLAAPAALVPPQPPSVAAPGPGTLEPSVPEGTAERLRRLKDLLDQGLITPDEYEKKRQEILKRL